jgi:mediator of RNA polymerase II transcription subunit 13
MRVLCYLKLQRFATRPSGRKSKAPYPKFHHRIYESDLLPPAIPFWETFGLEPASGPKDIAAYCIYPTGAKEGADAFMNRFSLLYTSCGLGKHNRGEGSKKFESGLGHWQVSSDKNLGYSQTMQGLRALCESLGKSPPLWIRLFACV